MKVTTLTTTATKRMSLAKPVTMGDTVDDHLCILDEDSDVSIILIDEVVYNGAIVLADGINSAFTRDDLIYKDFSWGCHRRHH
ncbi:hypothetical protein NDU88_000196 [Pleurodeles waltl]|uniref:Uncharacterized protein n=1 Tax=Pleurodeles waltl TaxID=8319 RepID=A0AAV7VWP3_PLEWA|nr:hypothetical protein NDU88_000196 [Pleurodeles waltl]